jgi:hypothetical protein
MIPPERRLDAPGLASPRLAHRKRKREKGSHLLNPVVREKEES